MGLADYAPRTESVEVAPGLTLDLRGLSVADVTALVRDHRPVLEALFERVVDAQDGASDATLLSIVLDLSQTAPALVGDVIALAAGEPGQGAQAARLPVTSQVEALKRIGDLTLKAEGGLEKLMGLWAMVAPLLPSKQDPAA